MHNNTPIVPYISLCSGYEGIGLGLHSCIPNLRCIAYCEREAYAIANLVAKMEKGLLDAAPVFTDVTTFPWEQFAPYMAGGILSFGWPCQPVSMAGKRKATEDERWLFDIIADGISILKPGMLFAENVEGLLSAKMPDGSLVFSHCIERLERLHYKVEAGIFSASETGAPHQRKRIFILAHREEQGLEGLRRLESDFIWNDASSYGTTRGTELGNANNYSDTEAGYAEAHRLQGEHWKDVCSRFAGGANATAWPSRPGEPQHKWEPPRVVGNASQREDLGREPRDLGEASSEWRCGNNALDCTSEGMGDTADRRWRQCNSEIGSLSQLNEGCADTSEFSKIECEVGRDAYESSIGMDISELSGLSHSELAEIREWMFKTESRTDELRLLGNGCVPATVSRAFLILLNKLNNK